MSCKELRLTGIVRSLRIAIYQQLMDGYSCDGVKLATVDGYSCGGVKLGTVDGYSCDGVKLATVVLTFSRTVLV